MLLILNSALRIRLYVEAEIYNEGNGEGRITPLFFLLVLIFLFTNFRCNYSFITPWPQLLFTCYLLIILSVIVISAPPCQLTSPPPLLAGTNMQRDGPVQTTAYARSKIEATASCFIASSKISLCAVPSSERWSVKEKRELLQLLARLFFSSPIISRNVWPDIVEVRSVVLYEYALVFVRLLYRCRAR